VIPRHFLKVSALLKPIAFILECDTDDWWINGSRFKFPYDVFIPNTSTAYNETPASWLAALSLAERNLAVEAGDFIQFAEARLDLDDTDDLTKAQRSLYYLHVRRGRPSGLILEAVAGSPATWKRVGVACIFDFKTGDLFVDHLFAEDEPLVEITILWNLIKWETVWAPYPSWNNLENESDTGLETRVLPVTECEHFETETTV
jgi:hypothetical protein